MQRPARINGYLFSPCIIACFLCAFGMAIAGILIAKTQGGSAIYAIYFFAGLAIFKTFDLLVKLFLKPDKTAKLWLVEWLFILTTLLLFGFLNNHFISELADT